MDAEMRQVIIVLLRVYKGNRSKVAKILHISRNTVAAVCKQMDEDSEGKPYGKNEERIKRISDEEYQSILKKVGLLSYRVVNLERKYDKQIRIHNVLAKFIDNSVTPRLNIIGGEFKSIAENITKNAKDIEDLQKDVGILNQVWYDRAKEIKEKSEAHQTERYRAEEESNKRAVKAMEEERMRAQVPVDKFFKKLEEINGKKSY